MAQRITKFIILLFLTSCVVIVKTLLIIPRGTCRYYPSCSNYAKEAFEKLPFLTAFYMVLRRLLKCNPFSKGGFDPIVQEKTERTIVCE